MKSRWRPANQFVSQVFAAHIGEGFDDTAKALFIASDVGLAFGAEADKQQVGEQILVFENGDVDRIDFGQEVLCFRRHSPIEPMKAARSDKRNEISVSVEARVVEWLFESTTEWQHRLSGLGQSN